MRSLPPFSVPPKLEITPTIEWDTAEAASGFTYMAADIPDAARHLLTELGESAGRLVGTGSFAKVYRATDHPDYAVKEVLKEGLLDPAVCNFSQSCGWAALRMNVALSDGLPKLPSATLSNGNKLVTPKYHGAYEDGQVFRVVMSFEEGTPIYAGNPAAGTRDERKLILDAAMIAAGVQPSATGKYDDEPAENYTNLLEQPDTNGTSRVVVLDASTIARSSLGSLLNWLL